MINQKTLTNVRAYVAVCCAIVETIRDVGPCKTGTLFAPLMDRMSAATFDRIIAQLEQAELIKHDPQTFTVEWIGPTLPPAAPTLRVVT